MRANQNPSNAMKSQHPRVAITMGDPAGIGPECLAKALSRLLPAADVQPVVIGDRLVWQRALEITGLDLPWRATEIDETSQTQPTMISVVSPSPSLSARDIGFGNPSRAACHATVEWIDRATRWAIEGRVQALCTGPIHKANLHRQGFDFPGHTEFLQHLTGTDRVVMMLAGPRLKVALVTIHEALHSVAGLLTLETIRQTIRITAEALVRDLAIPAPAIAVAGLNPHAGEAGRFGSEETEIIDPAIASFNHAPFRVSGPYPPDTVFHRAYRGEFDAVVAMYHDQGLIPIKLVHFDNAVNVTLGLPIVRTSVDHGTAYDIAGTGKADSRSMEEAIRLAAVMAKNRG